MLSQVSVIMLGRGSRVSLVPGHFLAPGPMSFPKEGRLSMAPDHFLGIYPWGLGYSGVRVSGGRALGVRYTQGWVRCTQGR